MLSRMRRTQLTDERGIHASYKRDPRGANCLTCLKLVDREGICDDQSLDFGASVQPRPYVDFFAECHGQSERIRIEMGSVEFQITDAARKFHRIAFFDPHTHAELKISGVADTRREDEDPERKPLVVVPG